MRVTEGAQLPDLPLPDEDIPGLQFGAVLSTKREEPHRALTSAILNGDVEAVKAFLKKPPAGFDFNARSYRGLNSPVPLLHLAIGSETPNKNKILQLLLNDPRIHLTTVTPDNVTSFGEKLVSALDEARLVDKYRRTPATTEAIKLVEKALSQELHVAVFNGDEKQTKALIKAGADPATNHGNLSLLAFAAGHSKPKVLQALVDAIPAAKLKPLLKAYAPNGFTPIQNAAWAGDKDSYEILRKAGADENQLDASGQYTAKKILNAVRPRGSGDRNKPGAAGHNILAEAARFVWGLTIFSGVGRFGLVDLSEDPNQPPPAMTGEEAYVLSMEASIQDYLGRLNRMLGTNHDVSSFLAQGQPQWAQIGALRIEGLAGWSTLRQREFINGRLFDLITMAGTETGRTVLHRLFDGGDDPVRILPSAANRARPNQDTTYGYTADGEIRIFLTGRSGIDGVPGSPEWANEENTPTDVILLHELLHAADFRVGQRYPNLTEADGEVRILFVNGVQVPVDEAMAVGLGPWAYAPSENTYRNERGLLRRNFYSNPNEFRNGLWGQPHDMWNSPEAWRADDFSMIPDWSDPEFSAMGERGPKSDFYIIDGPPPPLTGLAPRDLGSDDLTLPSATKQDYEDVLNALAVTIGKSMDFDELTMARLTDQSIAPQFRSLIIYTLNNNGLKLKPGQQIEEKVMYQAFDHVITALKTRVWNVFRKDPDKANRAAGIFNIYWNNKKGSDDADLVVRQAWHEWLEAKDVTAIPDASSPDATDKDRKATLKALIDRLVKSMDFGKKTVASLADEDLAGLFRSLVTYELNRTKEKLEKDYAGTETYWKVFHAVMNAFDEALPKAFDDKKKAKAAQDIFSEYWQNGGADEADELVREACDDWLKNNRR